ncbi:C39 family peptidase [Cellulosilyticum sp. I15G10I2]|uniref:C39 family peptidase n=1 Tax=Cellulosilyticum sp. I15G10I2 TaxID=1892843 RepID=UPI00085C5B4B|nr:C39 family peptidase [Cellulosilyticum sp. I15G10I2]
MKKLIVFFIILLVFSVGGVYGYYIIINSPDTLPAFINKQTPDGHYIIKKSGKTIEEFENKEEAIKKAKDIGRSVVVDKDNNEWIYSTLAPFIIITDTAIHDFEVFDSAMRYAKRNGHNKIYYNNDDKPIWEEQAELPEKIKMDVPVVLQLPELPRGCEVTSLAMIFKYHGLKINKMELADKIRKDTTPYKIDNTGRIYFGNPYDGFVGDMYNRQNHGYGVYHGPIAELADQYFKEKAIDITGLEFEDVLYFVSNGYPVWVVTNSTYKPLEESSFQMWHTPTGIVKVTQRQHAVVITGFDQNNIYINDPLYGKPNRIIEKVSFQKSWEQMGHQAVTIVK